MLKGCITCLLFFGMMAMAYGQEKRATATTEINGKSISIEYGSPALKGRSPAELMKQLPADRIWRAGAGVLTTLDTEADLMVEGKKLPAGKYSLYMYCPENGDFSLVINSDLGMPLGSIIPNMPKERANQLYPHFFNYTKEIGDKEVARVKLQEIDASDTQSLTYSFQPAGNNTLLKISWGTQAWTVELQPAQ